MTKLSECISFPKEKPEPKGYDHSCGDVCCCGCIDISHNDCLKECKDAVDKMELDVEKLRKFLNTIVVIKEGKTYYNRKPFNFVSDWLEIAPCDMYTPLAKAIADNLPKLLKEIK